MKNLHILLLLTVIGGAFGYEHYRFLSLKKNFDILQKETSQQEVIYNNKLNSLENEISTQNHQIDSMKKYINGSEILNTNISNIKKEYTDTKHNADSITKFQNKLFDNMGE